jgi:hypothetical protein
MRNPSPQQITGARRRLANQGFQLCDDVNGLDKNRVERANILFPDGTREAWTRPKLGALATPLVQEEQADG